jgi:hypothetical protein
MKNAIDQLHESLAAAARRAENDALREAMQPRPRFDRERLVLRLVFVAFVVGFCAFMAWHGWARAATPERPELWLAVNLTSYHLDRAPDYNERNLGIGLEMRFDHGLSAMAGAYDNSYSTPSAYLLAGWQPIVIKRLLHIGLFAGLATGYPIYDGDPGPVGGIFASVQNDKAGINLFYVPELREKQSAVIGLQVKARFR